MTKKIFAFILVLTLIFATSCVFAANELKDSMDKAKNTVNNVANGAGTIVKDAGTAITDGVKDVGNAINDGVRGIGGAVADGANKVTSDMTRTDNVGNNYDYTAVRTANEGTIMGMSPNTWTWFVLAIAALAIVGLVWYYAMQNKNEYHNHND